MRPLRWLSLVLMLSATTLPIVCQGQGPDAAPASDSQPAQVERVILFIIDGLADHAPERLPMPHLQKLAENGCTYHSMHLPLPGHPRDDPRYPWSCSMANPMLMAGTPFIGTEGIRKSMIQHQFKPDETAFVVNAFSYKDVSGGFGTYFSKPHTEDAIVITETKRLLTESKPVFMRVHLQRPGIEGQKCSREKYVDEPWYRNIWHSESPYRKSTLLADQHLGEFVVWLKEKDLWQGTVLLVCGDHGQANEGWHEPYSVPSSRTRLVIAGEGVVPGRKIESCEIFDIAPTIAHLTDRATPPKSIGRVLREAFDPDLSPPPLSGNVVRFNEVLRAAQKLSPTQLSALRKSGFLTIDEIGQWHTTQAGVDFPSFIRAQQRMLLNTTSSAVEVINVDVKRKPNHQAWESHETTIISQTERLAKKNASGELNRYGGGGVSVFPKTGFFNVQKIDESWVIVDPEGSPFISKGINSVKMGTTATSKTAFAHKFSNEDGWSVGTVKDLKAAGFNTLGSWSDWRRFRKSDARIPYTIMWNFMSSYGKKVGGVYQQSGHVGYPNGCIYVFDKAFEEFCDGYAQQMHELKNDPYLLGHFSDNEMPLRLEMLDRFLALKNSEEGYIAAAAWLKEQGVNPAQITDQIREAFVEYAAEKYFSIVKRAIRKHDPNHMYLGCRFHGRALDLKPLFKAAKEHVDILSINWYWNWTPDAEKMENWKQWSGRPFIITEFYAKGMDSGMGNTSGAGWVVKTQRERGYFYQNFTLGLLKHPNCVGWHWHRYMDNDPKAKQDPSNVDSNKGIVTSRYESHEDLISEMAIINTEVNNLRDRMRLTNSHVESPGAEKDGSRNPAP